MKDRRSHIPDAPSSLLILRIAGFVLVTAAFFLLGLYIIGPLLNTSSTLEPTPIATSTLPSDAPHPSPIRPSQHPTVTAVEVAPPSPSDPADHTSQPAHESDYSLSGDTKFPQRIPSDASTATPAPVPPISYKVQAGAFSSIERAERIVERLKASGFTPTIVKDATDDRILYLVQVGAFRNQDNAEAVADQVRAAGVEAYIAHDP